VARWALDDASGSQASDASGNGRTATLIGGPVWTTGKIGGALSFNGTTAYVSAPPSASVANLPQFTVAGWFKTNSSVRDIVLYSEGRTVGGDVSYFRLRLNAGGTPGRLNADLRTDSSSGSSNMAMGFNGNYNNNAWHHFAVVRSAANSWTLYVDGAAKYTSGQFAGQTTINRVTLGAWGLSTTRDYFPGLLDEVVLYNRALSASEIAALHDFSGYAP
jgi:hypothetical protein